MEEKEQLVRASQELLDQVSNQEQMDKVDNQLPFDPNDPKVKELEEWECSVSRSVIVEVGLESNLMNPSVRIRYEKFLISDMCFFVSSKFWSLFRGLVCSKHRIK